MTTAELKTKWDESKRDRADIRRGEAQGIENNLNLLNADVAALMAVIDEILLELIRRDGGTS